MANKVTIRGETYASATEAARDLGVSLAAVSAAKRRGALNRVGTSTRENNKGRPVQPVTIGDKHYPSAEAAANALGVDKAYIFGWLKVQGKLKEMGDEG